MGRYVVLLLERTHLKRYGNNIITIITITIIIIITIIIVAIVVTEEKLKCLISGM